MALNDPGTYVDSPGGKIRAVVPFYWNGSAYVASSGTVRTLNTPVASVGNGADTTEDTLQTYVLAGILRTVGDRLRIIAGGTMGATTDVKNGRIKFGGTTVATATGNAVGGTTWRAQADIVKTGDNAQVSISFGNAQGVTVQTSNVVLGKLESAAITILVTGQNATNSVAGSVTCNYLTVEYIPI